MKTPVVDKAKLPEVMRIICDADSLMTEKDCEKDKAAKAELEELQCELREITGNQQIIISDFHRYEEAEMNWWLQFLKINTGLENLTDYIFYPDFVGLDGNATLEQIADKVIADRR